MQHSILHSWKIDAKEAIAIQKSFASLIVRTDQFSAIRWVAGVDVGFEVIEEKTYTRAVVVVLEYPSFKVVDYALYIEKTTMPYIPGLLSFREVPALLSAFKKLTIVPDLVMVDGQGIAHPRRLGNASHLGLWLDLPTIGVAKSRLCGTYIDIGESKGSQSELMDRGEVIGSVLRSQSRVKPIFISIGHRISLESAVKFVENLITKYKLPEPIRLADRLASRRYSQERILTEWNINKR